MFNNAVFNKTLFLSFSKFQKFKLRLINTVINPNEQTILVLSCIYTFIQYSFHIVYDEFITKFNYRLTKPDQYALPLPNHYETTKTQRKSSTYYKISNYFYGPKSLDLPLPGAYNRKVYKFTI